LVDSNYLKTNDKKGIRAAGHNNNTKCTVFSWLWYHHHYFEEELEYAKQQP
jgi:hypothetical protein